MVGYLKPVDGPVRSLQKYILLGHGRLRFDSPSQVTTNGYPSFSTWPWIGSGITGRVPVVAWLCLQIGFHDFSMSFVDLINFAKKPTAYPGFGSFNYRMCSLISPASFHTFLISPECVLVVPNMAVTWASIYSHLSLVYLSMLSVPLFTLESVSCVSTRHFFSLATSAVNLSWESGTF